MMPMTVKQGSVGRVVDVERIRAVLSAHGRLGREVGHLSDEDDLYEAGMTSLARVNVMLALEGEFDVEFPDHMLNPAVFSSVAAIEAAIASIRKV